MKPVLLAAAMLFLVVDGFRALAQTQAADASTQNAKDSLSVDQISSMLSQNSTSNSDLRLGKKLHLRGPLISPFRGKKISELPRRALRLVNPFAATEPSPQLEKPRDVNPRAWSSIIGLHPADSAFADAKTHESSLGLVSLGR